MVPQTGLCQDQRNYCADGVVPEQFACHVDTVMQTTIVLQGSASELGILEEDLAAHLRLRFANDAAFLSYRGMAANEFRNYVEKQNEWLPAIRTSNLLVVVWTVGIRPPIAVHVAFSLSSSYDHFAFNGDIDLAMLGIMGRSDPTAWVEDALTRLVEDAATALVETRSGLP